MALKLGKCRLCLKLGDFFSIFAVDNALQLAEMAMECARVKIYEGDGLPDKVCSECVEKLSSAFIFKQQCERSDHELRRNYAPPPGFSITPPPNRQSSDSGFSNRTEFSNQTKTSINSSFVEVKPANSSIHGGKRSRENDKSYSVNSRDREYSYKASTSKSRVEELRTKNKRSRLHSDNTSKESDYDDNNVSQNMSSASDSDEPLVLKCDICDKQYSSKRSLSNHARTHSRSNENILLRQNVLVNIPTPIRATIPADDEEKVSCDKCGKTFKLKIMLKRHYESCQVVEASTEQSALEDATLDERIECKMCNGKFKNIDNLKKHMRVVHAAVLNMETNTQVDHKEIPLLESKNVPVPCVFCHKPFDDYYIHAAHFNSCSKRSTVQTYICLLCRRKFGKKSTYFNHLKDDHFEVQSRGGQNYSQSSTEDGFKCRMCDKKLANQDLLITHLAGHISNKDEGGPGSPDDSRNSTIKSESFSQQSDAGTPGQLQCKFCSKEFTYRKALTKHIANHIKCNDTIAKTEPVDHSMYGTPGAEDSGGSSDRDGDNTCDICEKEFSYKRLLLLHKRNKHNISSGTKRAKLSVKDCDVQCLICDINMKVSSINEHNQKHISTNIKPKNLYTCIECEDKFKSYQSLSNHIKFIHRLKHQTTKEFEVADLADFCEVVVTKTEPLDNIQTHNDSEEVPSKPIDDVKATVNLSGFTCPICSKKMVTLISLKRHINWHSNVGNNLESKHECFVCNTSFKFNRHYKLHMREHYHDTNLDPKHLTCTICNRKSKHLRAAQMHMKYHNQTRFNTKDYQCSICKRIFQYRKVYLSHMAIHYKRGESMQNTVIGENPAVKAEITVCELNQCPHCGKVCDSESSLKCHMSWHKSKSSLFGSRYECSFCNLQFTNKRHHEIHIRTHYEDDNGPFKCNVCGKGYSDEDYFKRHVKSHNFDNQSHKKRIEKLRMNKLKCPICTRYYPDFIKLIRHLRRTHPESKMIKTDPDAPPPQLFPCKLCAKVFETNRRLQSHEESHLRRHQFYKCKFCGKKAISLKNHNVHIKGHLTQKYVDSPLKCPHCEETFVRGYSLHYHLRDAHNINETWIAESGQANYQGSLKELQCSVCHKILASKGNFERHIDYHNLLRCNYCFDYFGSLKFLEGHLAFSCEKKKLIGETEVYPKKVKCKICYKAFHVEIKLDCHLRVKHGVLVNKTCGEKGQESVCDYCFRVFENVDSLNAHKVYHRTVGFFGCIYCNKKFNTLTVYRKHKNHHFSQLNVDNPIKCEHCEETFVAFREMIYHMRDVHGDDKEWVIMPKESIEEKCHICHKIFFNVQRHIQYHEDNRCKKCGEYFYSQIEFNNHLCSIESDEDPESNENDIRPKYEECTFCFKPITKTNSKLKHDLIHKGSGSISCRFCALKFKTIDAFNIHAFSHRSRKYKTNPLKCRECNEKFIAYGPFIKHMKIIHKIMEKMHYRTTILPEQCVVCGDEFPNLHNHYRAHLQHQCQSCLKYFTSNKLFLAHECDKEDANPSKVFKCDDNLISLINSYIAKDETDHQKYYGNSDDEGDVDDSPKQPVEDTPQTHNKNREESINNDIILKSTNNDMILMPISIQSPIISDVLSLYEDQSKAQGNGFATVDDDSDDVIEVIDDNSVNGVHMQQEVITID